MSGQIGLHTCDEHVQDDVDNPEELLNKVRLWGTGRRSREASMAPWGCRERPANGAALKLPPRESAGVAPGGPPSPGPAPQDSVPAGPLRVRGAIKKFGINPMHQGASSLWLYFHVDARLHFAVPRCSIDRPVCRDDVRNTGRSGWAPGFHTAPVQCGRWRFRIAGLISSRRLFGHQYVSLEYLLVSYWLECWLFLAT
jgi:hypothetical protein